MNEEGALKDCTVVVIGGSSGIGLETARLSVRAGARVVVAARDTTRLRKATETAPGVEGRYLDFTDDAALESFFTEVGPVDHLVITAAGAALGSLVQLDLQEARSFFEGKFWGTYQTVRRAVPALTSDGSVTLFAGAASRRVSPDFACGTAINGAIEALGRALAVELAPIRVNTVSPGVVDTPVWRNLVASDDDRAAFLKEATARLPVDRAGTPEEVAQAVLFLITNSFVTGEVLTIDGGYTLV